MPIKLDQSYNLVNAYVQNRQWATQRLKNYLVQGYAINQKRLEENKA